MLGFKLLFSQMTDLESHEICESLTFKVHENPKKGMNNQCLH